MTLSLRDSVVASRDQVACDLDDETVILSLKSGEYFGLNLVAAAVWRLIQERRSVAALRDALLAQFTNVTPEQCEAELLALLNQLVDLKLVEVA